MTLCKLRQLIITKFIVSRWETRDLTMVNGGAQFAVLLCDCIFRKSRPNGRGRYGERRGSAPGILTTLVEMPALGQEFACPR